MSRIALTRDLIARHPIYQAPLGGFPTVRLAATVASAGAIGSYPLHATRPADADRQLARLARLSRGPVVIAFTGEWEREELLPIALRHGFRHFHVLWWNGPRLAGRIRALGGTVLWQVGTIGQADEALTHGADALIAQGTEAGGPVRSPLPVRELAADLRAFAGDRMPIIAGGGLATRRDASEVRDAGADAALFGTRFLLTPESGAPARDKARLLRARSEDLLLDTRLVGTWPCAPRRRLVTAFDEDRPTLFAGLGVGAMHALEPAAALVRKLSPR